MTDINLIFGGTFDPIHLGHIHIINSLHGFFPQAMIRVIPCKSPVLKDEAEFDAEKRLAMLELALKHLSFCKIDKCELKRSTPSYALDTLQSLHEEMKLPTRFIFVMGTDAFAGLTKWHEWRRIFELAHIMVVPRAKFNFKEIINEQDELAAYVAQEPAELFRTTHGKIILAPFLEKDISSTMVRNALHNDESLIDYLPKSVIEYLAENSIKQRIDDN